MIKGATIKLTRRQALENMRQPIPNETKGDPDIHKKWKAIWDNKKEGKKNESNSNHTICISNSLFNIKTI
jgi:hypothetical protein